MNNSLINTLLIAGFTILVVAAGHYLTEVWQPARVQEIEDKITLARLEQAQVADLLMQQSASKELAEATLRKWKARYKFIPKTLQTADMVLYLESLTSSGFERFDVDLAGVASRKDFSYYTFSVNATAFFSSFYKFVWHVENNREFYRIRDLSISYEPVYKQNRETELPMRLDMVKAKFQLDAYFGGSDVISAPEEDLMPVPLSFLEARDPVHNSFYPVIRTDLPPNDEGLVDVESWDLVSIVGDRAVFESGEKRRTLSEGDRVYLGTIDRVDPMHAFVRVTLNKGGKVGTTEIPLEVGERYRQAVGEEIRIRPID